jgi:hypothetical protein
MSTVSSHGALMLIDGIWSKGQAGRARHHRPVAQGLDAYLRKKTVYVNYSNKETAPLMPYGNSGH